MIEIERDTLRCIVETAKEIMPMNYRSMDRLVAIVSYFEDLLSRQTEEPEEVKEDGRQVDT